MEVKTPKVYRHVLNVAVKESPVRSIGLGKVVSIKSGGISRTDRPKTEGASCWTRQKSLQENRLPPESGNRPIRLRPTGTWFIQVSLNRS